MFLEKHWSKRIKESKGNEVSCIASFEATTFESNEGRNRRGSLSLFSSVGTVRINYRTRDVSFDLLTS